MKKLSKEQAEYLIDSINKEIEGRIIITTNAGEASSIARQIRVLVTRAIEKCTEKKFPNFEMLTADRLFRTKITPGYIDDNLKLIFIEYESDSGDGDFSLYLDEFKQFTDGCIAIVKYLEESDK